MNQSELFPRDYSKGLTAQERQLLDSIIYGWNELKSAANWCKYHRSEWLTEQSRKQAA